MSTEEDRWIATTGLYRDGAVVSRTVGGKVQELSTWSNATALELADYLNQQDAEIARLRGEVERLDNLVGSEQAYTDSLEAENDRLKERIRVLESKQMATDDEEQQAERWVSATSRMATDAGSWSGLSRWELIVREYRKLSSSESPPRWLHEPIIRRFMAAEDPN